MGETRGGGGEGERKRARRNRRGENLCFPGFLGSLERHFSHSETSFDEKP